MVEPMGAETYLHLDSGATSCIARVQPSTRFKINQPFRVAFDLDHAHLFDATTEQALRSSTPS